MLGASPGASTAVWIMLQVIERCFPDKYHLLGRGSTALAVESRDVP